jgi:hypothetical protein
MQIHLKQFFFIDTSHHFVRLLSLQTDNQLGVMGISPSQLNHLGTTAAPDPNPVIQPFQ